MNKAIERLDERVIVGDIVKQLRRARKGKLGVDGQVGHDCPEPFGFGNHVGIQCSNVFSRSSVKGRDKLGGGDEIAGLEMMRNTLDLDTSMVVKVGKLLLHGLGGLFDLWVRSIVTDDNTEAVTRVVDHASSTDSIHDHVNVLLAASDQDIDRGANVATNAKLFSLTAADGSELPELVDWKNELDIVKRAWPS